MMMIIIKIFIKNKIFKYKKMKIMTKIKIFKIA